MHSKYLSIAVSAFLILDSAPCQALQRASISGDDVLDHVETLQKLRKAFQNWQDVSFSGEGFDGIVFYSTIGSGIAITSVAIYVKPIKGGRWTLRSYQEIRSRKIKVEVRDGVVGIYDVEGDQITRFWTKYLSPILVK